MFRSPLFRSVVHATLFLFLLPALALAADKHCGRDYDRNGSVDAWCPSPDQDWDGYFPDGGGFYTGEDCDDQDWQIFPGVITTKGCTGGQTRKCNADGTFTSCTSDVVCEATGSGVCRYVNPGTGNDSTGDGSFGSPWQSFKCFGWWSSGAPACNTILPAGSVVYVVGSTDVTSSLAYDPDGAGGATDTLLYLNSARSGTETNPITLKAYPTYTGKINPGFASPNKRFMFTTEATDFWRWEGFEITNGYGNAFFVAGGSDGHEFSRIYCHDIDGVRTDNHSCLYLNNGGSYFAHHSQIIDIADYDETSLYDNVSAIVIFNDNTGGNHRVEYNILGYTNAPSYAGNKKGTGGKFKHGANVGTFTRNYIRGNLFVNTRMGWETGTASTTYSGNVFLDSNRGIKIDSQTPTYNRDQLVELNTFVNTPPFEIVPEYTNAPSSITFRKNVAVDPSASFGIDQGVIRVDPYGTSDNNTLMTSVVSINENCYYCPNASCEFNWFSNGGGGAEYTFANWQSVKGYDLLSFVKNPNLASNTNVAQDTDCDDWGWNKAVADSPPPPPPTIVEASFTNSRLAPR